MPRRRDLKHQTLHPENRTRALYRVGNDIPKCQDEKSDGYEKVGFSFSHAFRIRLGFGFLGLKPDVLDLGCFCQSYCNQHGEHLFTLVQVAAVDPKFAKAEALGP